MSDLAKFKPLLDVVAPFRQIWQNRELVWMMAVRSIEVSGGRAALSFEYVGGHVYGVRATRDLVHPEWLAQKVRTGAEGAELEQVVPSADPDGVGETTIWMTPAGDAAQGFYVLEAK